METNSTIFYDSEEYKISKTANGKFEVYDKNKKTAIGEFDTLRKATNSIKTIEADEVKHEWTEPELPKRSSKRKKR